MIPAAGYAHPEYAASLAEWGTPRHLLASGAWMLERAVPGRAQRDAMACYPLLMAPRWDRVREDLERLAGDVVSVTAVCDPFGAPAPSDLARIFELVRPFKTHVVVDFRTMAPVRHHLRYVRAALRRVRVEEVGHPSGCLDDWCALYDVLVARHTLTGLHAFSRAAFRRQLAVPGIRMFRAVDNGTTVAAQLWYVVNRVAYMHLLASSRRGYAIRAAYAVMAEALQRLAADADCADLGGSAGTGGDDGLFRFKAGWSAGRIPVHLCGTVLQPDVYRVLCDGRASTYFPAYRDAELVPRAGA